MILPLPLLQPGWLLSETDHSAAASLDAFLNRLSDSHWNVLRYPCTTEDPARPCDILFIDLAKHNNCATLEKNVENARKRSVPILFRGPASLVERSSARFQLRPMLLTPSDLSYWWGPERMDEELIRNTPPIPVTSITLGRLWAIVETTETMGLAAMAHRSDGLPSNPRDVDLQSMIGMPLKDVAAGLRSPAGVQRTVACAAVNAGIAPPVDAPFGDGLQSEKSIPDGTTVIVGRFPALQTKRPEAIVLEMDPGPNDLPAEAAPHVIPGARELLITASAWCNGTLSGLLRLAQNVPVTLIGPGTPLTPALHAYGITKLAGFRIRDRDAVRSAIANGGGVKSFKEFGDQILLSAE